MAELKKTSYAYEVKNDDGEHIEISEYSIDGNIGICLEAEQAARILNDVAGDVDIDLLAEAFEFLTEHHKASDDDDEETKDEDVDAVEDDETDSNLEVCEVTGLEEGDLIKTGLGVEFWVWSVDNDRNVIEYGSIIPDKKIEAFRFKNVDKISLDDATQARRPPEQSWNAKHGVVAQ